MRKTLVRTFTQTEIHAVKIYVENGEVKQESLAPITEFGDLTMDEAVKAVRKTYGKNLSVAITKLATSETKYEMSIEDFIKYATKITNTEKDGKENE